MFQKHVVLAHWAFHSRLDFLAVVYFSVTRHQVVKVAKVAKLVYIYLTRGIGDSSLRMFPTDRSAIYPQGGTFKYGLGGRLDNMVLSICHIWYYTTTRIVNSEENDNSSGTRSLV